MPSTPSASEAPPARRADARRNRERILEAARTAFIDPEADASMAEVARRASVGMATLYRNFASRRELLESLWAAQVDEVCAAAAPAPGSTPGEALEAWLRRFFTFAASKRALGAELLTHAAEDSALVAGSRTRVLAAGRPLFQRAQEAGQVRHDLVFEQVLDMLRSIATIDGDARYREPILRTALDGLAAPAARSRA